MKHHSDISIQLASTEENSYHLLTLKSKHKHKLEQKFKEMLRIHTFACIFRKTFKYIKYNQMITLNQDECQKYLSLH